nr:hypothetical protein [Tanacetum cinerariifolium]
MKSQKVYNQDSYFKETVKYQLIGVYIIKAKASVIICFTSSRIDARYHSLHHTQFRTNYSLFMPFYDYIYGTMDKSSDTLYEKSLQRKEELPNVVHLTHLTAPESIYYTRLGFASLASEPHTSSKWYSRILWPVTVWSTLITRVYGKLFVVERNVMENLKLQTWLIPKYNTQYLMRRQKQTINGLTEEAILEAEAKEEEELNKSGELFIRRNPQLKVKVKVACYLALALCQRGIQVAISKEKDCQKLKSMLQSAADDHNKKCVKIVFYYTTPLMLAPKHLENVDSCKNWLPRRVMRAWRIAGILHGLEGWNVNENGNEILMSTKFGKPVSTMGLLLS